MGGIILTSRVCDQHAHGQNRGQGPASGSDECGSVIAVAVLFCVGHPSCQRFALCCSYVQSLTPTFAHDLPAVFSDFSLPHPPPTRQRAVFARASRSTELVGEAPHLLRFRQARACSPTLSSVAVPGVVVCGPDSSAARPAMSTTPSIRISQHHRYPTPYTSKPYTAAPIPVPMAQEPVPPPLPPPANILGLASGRDPGWQWGNDPDSSDFGRAASVQPGSSLLGSSVKSRHARIIPVDHERRGSSISTVTGVAQYDSEMADERSAQGDESGQARPSSNNRYVWWCMHCLQHPSDKQDVRDDIGVVCLLIDVATAYGSERQPCHGELEAFIEQTESLP